MHELCTYFDRNFLAQGVALARSVERVSPAARLWILCLDDYTRTIVAALGLANVRTLSVDDLLAFDPALERARHDRSPVEFYYACTPRLPQLVLREARGTAPGATYVDADMFFFDRVERIFDETPSADVVLVEHRSASPKEEAEHGRFNVCLVGFRDTPEASRALDWWAEVTLASTRLGGGVWGDQKYLDEFPTLFRGVEALADPGLTLAPWNLWRHRVREDGGRLLVDDSPLGAYHFARFLPLHPHVFMPIRRTWISRTVLELVYRPYMQAVRAALQEIRAVDPEYRLGYTSRNLRGLLLGALAGRAFYEGRRGLRRIGLYVPAGRDELLTRRLSRAQGSRS